MVQKAQWQEPEVADGVASAGVCVCGGGLRGRLLLFYLI